MKPLFRHRAGWLARLMIAAVLAAGVGASAGTPASAQDRPAASLRAAALRRLTLVVNDIDKSIDFYQRIGLAKASDKTLNADQGGIFGGADLPLTADSKQSRVVVLTSGDDLTVTLVAYDRPPLPSARGNLVGIGTGDVIFGILVPDIEGAYGRLNQIGTRFSQPPSHFAATDGTAQSGQHLYAYDPDGHMVEIIQLDRR